MPRKTTTKTKPAESKIIEKQEWLKFKIEAFQDVPAKHWWASPSKNKVLRYANVRAKDIVMVSQYSNDPLNKTFIVMSNGNCFIAVMPYEKVIELI